MAGSRARSCCTERLAGGPQRGAEEREVLEQKTRAFADVWCCNDEAERHQEHPDGGSAADCRRAGRPPSQDDQQRDRQLHDSNELGSALDAEGGVEPEEERAVAHHGLDTLCLGGGPLERAEKDKKEDE